MTRLVLYIGDKNLSSWSLRPWLAMKQTGIPFKEEMIRLDRPESKGALRKQSPSGLVPCLVDDDVKVWESLAILEYLADSFPEKNLWPSDRAARAHARAISAEMHAGFSALRTVWPMNYSRTGLRHLTSGGVDRDISRILTIWTQALERFSGSGEFLYGDFSIADAMYAPVVSRFMTYGPIDAPPAAARYMDMMFSLPAMREWGEGAAAEAGEQQ